ncbi:MAG: histidine phosphatase family protein [Candidatus Abawacabacteria bacterium]|nr:histidine phosphatase family protein [Candidatus Abawacabacteria bacterium]
MTAEDIPVFEELPEADEGPTRIMLIRHARSAWNALSLDGRALAASVLAELGDVPDSEIPLTSTGITEALQTGRKLFLVATLGKWDIADAILYRSDTTRTRGTLREILNGYYEMAGCDIPDTIKAGVKVDDGVAERDFGETKSWSIERILATYPHFEDERTRDGPFFFRPPLGKSMEDVGITQVRPWLLRVMEQHKDKTVIAVTHGGPIHVARAILERWTRKEANERLEPSPPNCSVTTYIHSPQEKRYVLSGLPEQVYTRIAV